ncbi:D-alanyl-D-alanine carboxypeptidase/D-alanyl-D-alanine-endopeptidase [uncultured Sunxiuqinia sp.]|uniref:D-alanyl-D-alanine carboxypeptidase/D-alanyl-D-alanine endopeptidase n=1 Tax=uncultured Sunxiuqinia sp. TaxID=1573825 RepID=UPI0030D8769B
MNKVKLFFAGLFILCVGKMGTAQQTNCSFKNEVALWTTHTALRHAGIGIYLQDSETGEVLAQTDPQLSLVPGSTLKLITTATALEMLGPDFRFETQLAYSGEIKNDTLFGDLVIVGGGDPALGSNYFKEHYLDNHFLNDWIKSLQNRNIVHITGNLVTDATIFEDQMIPNTWIWEDLGNYYGAGASGLSVYDNLYKIHFSSPQQSGEPTRIKYTNPYIPGLEFENQVKSSNINRDLAYVFGAPKSNKHTIRGTIPKGRNDFVIKASVPDPPFLLAWELKNRMAENGLSLAGFIQEKKGLNHWPLHPLTRTLSPKLIDIVRVTNHESVNLFAEHLLKYLAWLTHGEGSTQKGLDVMTDFWEKQGIRMDGCFLADGSGLSHFNAITARQMVDILYYMKTNSLQSNLFFNSLPYVPNGTLYFFNPLNFPGKSLRAKSGSMTRVRCYAGEITTQNNQHVLFAIFLNNFSCSQTEAIKLVEELLVRIAEN